MGKGTDQNDHFQSIPDKSSSILTFFVNGKKVTDPEPDPSTTLLTYLRTKLRY